MFYTQLMKIFGSKHLVIVLQLNASVWLQSKEGILYEATV